MRGGVDNSVDNSGMRVGRYPAFMPALWQGKGWCNMGKYHSFWVYADVYLRYCKGELSPIALARKVGIRNAIRCCGGAAKKRHGITNPIYPSRALGYVAADMY